MSEKRLIDEVLDRTEDTEGERTNLESMNTLTQSLNTIAGLFFVVDKEIESKGGVAKIRETFDDELKGLITIAKDFIDTSFDNTTEEIKKAELEGKAPDLITSIKKLFEMEEEEEEGGEEGENESEEDNG